MDVSSYIYHYERFRCLDINRVEHGQYKQLGSFVCIQNWPTNSPTMPRVSSFRFGPFERSQRKDRMLFDHLMRMFHSRCCSKLNIRNAFNILRPRQDGRYLADDVLKCIFLNENVWISLKIPLKFVPKGPINNILALVQIMAWRRPGYKPLTEPMLVFVATHICVTRPQWVKLYRCIVVVVCFLLWNTDDASLSNLCPYHKNVCLFAPMQTNLTSMLKV